MYYIQVVDTGHIIGYICDEPDYPYEWHEVDSEKYDLPQGWSSPETAIEMFNLFKHMNLPRVGNMALSYYSCRVVQLIPTFKVVGE